MSACDALRQIGLRARGVDNASFNSTPSRAAIAATLRSAQAKGRRRARVCRSPHRDSVVRAMATSAGGVFLSRIWTLVIGRRGRCTASPRLAFCRRRARDRIEQTGTRGAPGGNFSPRSAARISRRFVGRFVQPPRFDRRVRGRLLGRWHFRASVWTWLDRGTEQRAIDSRSDFSVRAAARTWLAGLGVVACRQDGWREPIVTAAIG